MRLSVTTGTPDVFEEFVLTPRPRQWSHSRSTHAGFAAIDVGVVFDPGRWRLHELPNLLKSL